MYLFFVLLLSSSISGAEELVFVLSFSALMTLCRGRDATRINDVVATFENDCDFGREFAVDSMLRCTTLFEFSVGDENDVSMTKISPLLFPFDLLPSS